MIFNYISYKLGRLTFLEHNRYEFDCKKYCYKDIKLYLLYNETFL